MQRKGDCASRRWAGIETHQGELRDHKMVNRTWEVWVKPESERSTCCLSRHQYPGSVIKV